MNTQLNFGIRADLLKSVLEPLKCISDQTSVKFHHEFGIHFCSSNENERIKIEARIDPSSCEWYDQGEGDSDVVITWTLRIWLDYLLNLKKPKDWIVHIWPKQSKIQAHKHSTTKHNMKKVVKNDEGKATEIQVINEPVRSIPSKPHEISFLNQSDFQFLHINRAFEVANKIQLFFVNNQKIQMLFSKSFEYFLAQNGNFQMQMWGSVHKVITTSNVDQVDGIVSDFGQIFMNNPIDQDENSSTQSNRPLLRSYLAKNWRQMYHYCHDKSEILLGVGSNGTVFGSYVIGSKNGVRADDTNKLATGPSYIRYLFDAISEDNLPTISNDLYNLIEQDFATQL